MDFGTSSTIEPLGSSHWGSIYVTHINTYIFNTCCVIFHKFSFNFVNLKITFEKGNEHIIFSGKIFS
jgi:hypothetical protein